MKCVNLMPAARRQAKACRLRLRGWAVWLGVYAVVVVAGYVACFAFADKSEDVLGERIAKVRQHIRGSGRAILELRRKIAVTEQRLATARDVGKHPDWSLLLAMLAKSLSDDVVLENCLLEPLDSGQSGPPKPAGPADANSPQPTPPRTRRFRLKLGGFARSQTAVSRFVLRLESTGLFHRVRLVKAHRREFLSGDAIMFHIECALGGEEGGGRK